MAEKVPPHNIEAERSILGSILIDDTAIIKVAQKLMPEDFYDPKHKALYEALLELYREQSSIDVITLGNYLKAHKLLARTGGTAYVAELVADTVSAANIADYSDIVKATSTRRKLIQLSGDLTTLAFSEDKELTEIIGEIESRVFNINTAAVKSDFKHVGELLTESFERTDDLSSNPDKLRGIPTGFASLDKLLGGLNRSDLIILAARPSVGKSSFAIDVARHAAVEHGVNVGIFSLEMANVQIMDRVLSMQMQTNLFRLRMGKLGDEMYMKFAEVADKLSKSGLYIDDTPGQTITDIATKSRKLKLEKGLDLLIIDYLQLVQGHRKENRVQEVSDISRTLKILARELEIPIIAAAQLSRAVEQRVDKRPQLSDLRESGSIEQDADIVMFLQRDDMFDPDVEKKNLGYLYIAKHRNGPTGQIDLVFVEDQARFRELSK